jgi:predicted nuclease of predicted toxin-antitoxin system
MRFLIDECLSPALVQIVIDAGFECSCVRDRGLLGATDPKLMKFLLQEDFILVPENANDFRALCGATELHAGLVCSGASPMNLETQRELLQIALEALGDDLVNQVLEVTRDHAGEVTVSTHEHAAPG